LKTSDFNSTSTSLVNTANAQTINGEKTFSNTVLVKNGRGSIKVYPPNQDKSGQRHFTLIDILTKRCHASRPLGNSVMTLFQIFKDFEWLTRSFVFCCGGGGTLTPRFSH
jgi:hypothetical protein